MPALARAIDTSLVTLNARPWPTSTFAQALPWLREVPPADEAPTPPAPTPVRAHAPLTATQGVDGVGELTLEQMSLDAPARLRDGLGGFCGVRALLLDLRSCPDDDQPATQEVADGLLRALTFDPVARDLPLAVLVDDRTGPAGEALASRLQAADRAVIVGIPAPRKPTIALDTTRLVPQVIASAERARRLLLQMA